MGSCSGDGILICTNSTCAPCQVRVDLDVMSTPCDAGFTVSFYDETGNSEGLINGSSLHTCVNPYSGHCFVAVDVQYYYRPYAGGFCQPYVGIDLGGICSQFGEWIRGRQVSAATTLLPPYTVCAHVYPPPHDNNSQRTGQDTTDDEDWYLAANRHRLQSKYGKNSIR